VTTLVALESALEFHAVHVGFPVERRKLAGELLSAGVSVGDVEIVAIYCQQNAEVPSACMAAILSRPMMRAEKIEELRTFASAKAAREEWRKQNCVDKKRPPEASGEALRQQNMNTQQRLNEEWDAYVAERKAKGLPLVGPRPPHPWEKQA
jgi:hypothetical protein